jgi:5-methylcytosine-specific restriction endonuclease McrA
MSFQNWWRRTEYTILASHKTLVLNADESAMRYPFHFMNGVRTMQALALGRIAVIKPGLCYIHSAKGQHNVPSVVRLTTQVNAADFNRTPPLTLANLYLRDGGVCQYTGVALRIGSPNLDVQATIDHVQPRARGGLNAWQNVVLAAASINTKKACRTPIEARLTLLSKPSIPTQADLFAEWLTADKLSDIPADWHPHLKVVLKNQPTFSGYQTA